MPSTLSKSLAPVISSERRTGPGQAKADLRKAESHERRLIGKAIDRARQLRGWNLDEFAQAVKRDPRQCARWFDGSERAQMDALFAVESLRQPLIVAFAEVAGAGVEVVTEIRVRRTA